VIFEKHSDPASHRDKPLKNLILAVYGLVERFAIRRADAVIATGEGLVAQARAVAPGKPIHHIFDIPSSLVEPDARRAAEIRASWRRAPDDVLALYVGSFAVYQGIDLMFEAMPEVLRRCPSVRFVIIGGSAPRISERRTWLEHRGIADRVTFAGWVAPDELPHHLAAADVLLSPRLSGINTPLKLLDYLKAGRAIVATDNQANRQILDESCAVLTAPTPADFAAGIVRVAADGDLQRRLAGAGRERLDRLYSFAEFKRRLETCYASLLAGAG
jgi:glycosyltransferase involved in cell wall biosynthesis